ncbi:MAG: SRPBCC domain-containing protein [Solirubrobacterales bacterium]|nr:SRPBCC domain-containing protein [Solirubrobacterales bacterium]
MTATGDSVHIVKEVGAPVDRVYRAFVDPEQLVRWMHPDQFQGISAENDPRVGGRGELRHSENGVEVGGFDWEYLEVVENSRLVMDWQFRGFGQAPGGRRSRMTIELRAIEPGRTEVSLTHDRLGEAPPGGHLGVNTGWTQALDSLARYVTSQGEE